jgi:DNA-directed RNA polymerase subunit RPC12/RpoP
MIIKKYKIPVELHYYCDDCKTEIKFDLETDTLGRVLLSNPPQYVHICPKCNKKYHLDTVYPCIVYEDKTVAHDIITDINGSSILQ